MKIETGPGWELRCGDCLDVTTGLASLDAVDHVLTDPPYSDALYERTRSNNPDMSGRAREGALALASKRIGSVDDIIAGCSVQFARIVARWVIIFHDDDAMAPWSDALIGAGLERIRRSVWLKTDPMPQTSGDRPAQDIEHVTWAHQPGRKRWNNGGCGGSIIAPRCKGKDRPNHPSPKPVGVMETLTLAATDPGDLICDPFAGSGTTGLAALRNGRHFIGWERDPDFFDVAVKRLRSTREQMQLFDAIKRHKPKQASLFDVVSAKPGKP
jgi:site-specific DNA-methyltransferase (adenine-specific)